jgi:hypothetical protein
MSSEGTIIPFDPTPNGEPLEIPKSPEQLLKESELRNMGLVEYILLLEKICKSCMLHAGRRYEELSYLITPHSEQTMDVLAQICIATAPICGDVEEMKMGGVPEKIIEMITERETEDAG